MSSFIKKQIELKKQSTPYYSTLKDVKKSVTDRDHFPYTRPYRGQIGSSMPIVYGRTPGFRKTNQSDYKMVYVSTYDATPNVCFQGACEATLPCVPKKHIKYNCIVLPP